MTGHTLNADKTAAVATEVFYQPMSTCPIGVKCILLNPGSVAVISQYNGKGGGWLGWYPLPRRRRAAAMKVTEKLIEHKELH